MEKTDAEKHAYGALERFLYIILLPVLFTLVLVGVLLTLFDYDVKGALYQIGRTIPVVKSFVPAEEGHVNPANATVLLEERLSGLEAELAEKNARIAELQSELAAREQAYEALEADIEGLLLGRERAAEDAAEYRAQLKALANMYTGMSAGKAAAILEQMSLPELVLILYEMRTDDRGTLLARMDPEIAAAASLELKDITESNWAEFERKARGARDGTDDGDAGLSVAELAGTFAVMEPESAATILLELNKQNAGKTVAILGAMTEQARSRVLTAIAETSAADAAALADRLGGQ